MRKLHLSIISLGLCLILGVGSLAAQGRGRGGNNKSQSTFLVDLVAGAAGMGVVTTCFGEAPGSNLEARFDSVCLVVQGNNLTLSLSLISSKFTKKALSLNMFFRLVGGDARYQGDNIPAFIVSGDPFDGDSFRLGVNQIVTLRKSGQPDKGSVAFDIAVGHVVYMKE